MKTKYGAAWIDQAIIRTPIHIGLCISEEQQKKVLKELKIKATLEWPDSGCGKAWFFDRHNGKGKVILVCIDPGGKSETWDDVDVYGLIVHETSHVFQYLMDELDEDEPGDEIKAYGLQTIFVNLAAAYRDMNGADK